MRRRAPARAPAVTPEARVGELVKLLCPDEALMDIMDEGLAAELKGLLRAPEARCNAKENLL